MTHEGNGQPIQYRIDFSEQITQEIQDVQTQAITKGFGNEASAAFQIIFHRLTTDPAGFGELVQRFLELNLVAHVASIPPITIKFAYHEEKRFVIIMKVHLNLP